MLQTPHRTACARAGTQALHKTAIACVADQGGVARSVRKLNYGRVVRLVRCGAVLPSSVSLKFGRCAVRGAVPAPALSWRWWGEACSRRDFL